MSSRIESRALPEDYLHRVYAGVLGKLIGVYIGRPYEGWTHQRVLEELGHVRYYINDHFHEPLVITDDDVSGTFQFIRALEEHGISENLTSKQIGQTWLNNVIEHRTIFWWSGRGISTEHTAFLNLKSGIPAPLSGSIDMNGKTVAEQIGAQIFIDGWALVSPGNPKLAAKFAKAAGSVSHDGESVFAAQLWAAMEAEAFYTKDVDRLLDIGLSLIPRDSLIARVIGHVRQWVKEDNDWLKTRQRIEDKYGYDKFHGICHVVPNHAVMIMAILYAAHDFDEAMHIINTCGWDTDCNSGNVGCLVAIINGMSSFNGRDWRGPIADRALISSADGGYSINNAARIALDIANLGRQLKGLEPMEAPKGGAQYHFTLPGSVQGFQVHRNDDSQGTASVSQGLDEHGDPALAIKLHQLGSDVPIEVSTETFTPQEIKIMRTYDLMASPLVYPGQTIHFNVSSSSDSSGDALVAVRLQVYTNSEDLRAVDASELLLSPGKTASLELLIPDDMESQPIHRVGLAIRSNSATNFNGKIWLERLYWQGAPTMTIRRPKSRACDFWYRSWVNGADSLNRKLDRSLYISQGKGEGIILYGTRDWDNYRVVVPKFTVILGAPSGVAIRAQGLNRYYSLVFVKGDRVSIVKALDSERITLVSAELQWSLDDDFHITIEAQGNTIVAHVGGISLTATDSQYKNGALGLIATDGSISTDEIRVEAL
ncbi:unnamed protein product [Clonostachys solani]|uniref:ADP-ribosylglycohydrolase family protein n=1 Tax=Clonostachys solani TaxID=160281 RepID=A0A9P0ERK3_9HYPO|nr:unnamed protein product [Clonostachys solani]